MSLRHRILPLAFLLVTGVLLAGCGTDDGTGVREEAAGSGSGSGVGAATGLSEQDLGATTDDPLILDAVEGYRGYIVEQVDELVAATTTFTDAVRAGDLEAAKEAYAPSRVPWERIEPIAGLIEEIDGAVDSRVDDFAGPDDPEFTGWHRLEYLLWEEDTTEGGAELADQLDADLATLQDGLADLKLPPAAVARGGAELIEEVSQGKITGEEDRYSHEDLSDFQANVDGAREVIELLTPALEEADPELLARIQSGFDDLQGELDELRDGGDFVPYCLGVDPPVCEEVTIDGATVDRLTAQLGALSEDLAQVPGTLGLS